MITNTLGALLQELSQSMGVPHLHPDEHDTCIIRLSDDLKIHLELDPTSQYLIIGIDLGPIPAGKYRENLFKEALKANNIPHPRHGVFAYSDLTKHLILFEQLPIQNLRGEHVAAEIPFLKEKAMIWKESIEKRQLPPNNQTTTSTPRQGLFGLTP